MYPQLEALVNQKNTSITGNDQSLSSELERIVRSEEGGTAALWWAVAGLSGEFSGQGSAKYNPGHLSGLLAEVISPKAYMLQGKGEIQQGWQDPYSPHFALIQRVFSHQHTALAPAVFGSGRNEEFGIDRIRNDLASLLKDSNPSSELDFFSAWLLVFTRYSNALRQFWTPLIESKREWFVNDMDTHIWSSNDQLTPELLLALHCLIYEKYLSPNNEPTDYRDWFSNGNFSFKPSSKTLISALGDCRNTASLVVKAATKNDHFRAALKRCFGFEFTPRRPQRTCPESKFNGVDMNVLLAGTRTVGKTSLLLALHDKTAHKDNNQAGKFICEKWKGAKWSPIGEDPDSVDTNLTSWRNRSDLERNKAKQLRFRGVWSEESRTPFNIIVRDVAGEDFSPNQVQIQNGAGVYIQQYLERDWLNGCVIVVDTTATSHQQEAPSEKLKTQVLGLQTVGAILELAKKQREKNGTPVSSFPLQILLNKADLLWEGPDKAETRNQVLIQDDWSISMFDFLDAKEYNKANNDDELLALLERNLLQDIKFASQPGITKQYLDTLRSLTSAANEYKDLGMQQYRSDQMLLRIFRSAKSVSISFSSTFNDDPDAAEQGQCNSAIGAWKRLSNSTLRQFESLAEQNFMSERLEKVKDRASRLKRLRDFGRILSECLRSEKQPSNTFTSADEKTFKLDVSRIAQSWKANTHYQADWEKNDSSIVDIIAAYLGLPVHSKDFSILQIGEMGHNAEMEFQVGQEERRSYRGQLATLNPDSGAKITHCPAKDRAKDDTLFKLLENAIEKHGSYSNILRASLVADRIPEDYDITLDNINKLNCWLANYKPIDFPEFAVTNPFDFAQFQVVDRDKATGPFNVMSEGLNIFSEILSIVSDLYHSLGEGRGDLLSEHLTNLFRERKGIKDGLLEGLARWWNKITGPKQKNKSDAPTPSVDTFHPKWTQLGNLLEAFAASHMRGLLLCNINYLLIKKWDRFLGGGAATLNTRDTLVHLSEKLKEATSDPFEIFEKGAGGTMTESYEKTIRRLFNSTE